MCSVALIANAGSTETKDAVIGGGIIYLTGTLGISNTGNTRHIYMRSTSNVQYAFMYVDTKVYVGSYLKSTVSSITERNATMVTDTKNYSSQDTIIGKGYHAYVDVNGNTIYLHQYTPSGTPTQAAG
jgi:hypothetical protein